MSEENQNSSQEKTEQPTQRRIDKAKEEGKTVTSKEMYVFSSVIMLFVVIYFFSYNFNYILANWRDMFYFLNLPIDNNSPLLAIKKSFYKVFLVSLIIGVPVLILTIFTQSLVGGITFSFKAIEWKSSKLDPIQGLKRIFSVKGLVELLKSILKVALLFGVSFYILYIKTDDIIQLSTEKFEHSLVTAAGFFPLLILVLLIVLLLIAILDWTWQKYSFIKSLRMSRQDLKDENKETEGSPEVKAKIKRLQLETVRKAIKQAEAVEEVKNANAVIVNPTHFAVALKYDVGAPGAPTVLSMGRGQIAQKIIEKAKENKITVFRHKLLARALYFTSEIGSEISEKLYTAVAIALAYIYKINNGENLEEPDIQIPDELMFNEDGAQINENDKK
ncbi:MAG: Flagellar biosynthetic protein FlhB [Alphaproteobacteria bacterium MarineAlpha9_Bin4]|nr:flagellar biosynthesis protein FlhB [Pelagibacterales bacterium]PPR26893.1 MAG: Flagellar biosynthetic protein FlhB [Alphaproteobacteria bacterium MarineAlpha9_Bin4]|tara:strand:+ start:135 stop:1301 length:1167 start_codon:yes stop_codon:yes gene_type:complete